MAKYYIYIYIYIGFATTHPLVFMWECFSKATPYGAFNHFLVIHLLKYS